MTEEQIKDLELNSQMLGQICAVVEQVRFEEGVTTLDGVKLMAAELFELRAEKLRNEVYED